MLAALLLLLLTTLTAAAATNSRLTQLLSLVSLSPPLPLPLYLHLILFLLSSFPSPLPLSLLLSSPSLSFGINLSLPPPSFLSSLLIIPSGRRSRLLVSITWLICHSLSVRYRFAWCVLFGTTTSKRIVSVILWWEKLLLCSPFRFSQN
ncbi:hypothetical protein ASPFODRAFT_533956 [Aspergillus luchuensis CBS 106.47]|uniref:REJ domain-containing protein n=1 Tax=Aspergillus luchuensis (strain CBS 106.47) TaxID=1137211 RepID=A0A1M3TMZ5_ASPLC|nr:hypothetical protein ASPFODRAFT_533956 [Aspergillus luchuensis CBS 106.47]